MSELLNLIGLLLLRLPVSIMHSCVFVLNTIVLNVGPFPVSQWHEIRYVYRCVRNHTVISHEQACSEKCRKPRRVKVLAH
jgi:hypothetical protein